jgi:hypothetical protein
MFGFSLNPVRRQEYPVRVQALPGVFGWFVAYELSPEGPQLIQVFPDLRPLARLWDATETYSAPYLPGVLSNGLISYRWP